MCLFLRCGIERPLSGVLKAGDGSKGDRHQVVKDKISEDWDPREDLIAKTLAGQFQDRGRRHGRFVVAIDGPGCCGKSSLSEKVLALTSDSTQLATDDFHLPRGSTPDPESPLPYRRWKEFMVAVGQLVEGLPARFRPILLIEGIAALHPALASIVDYRVWVDGRASTRMERVRMRDGDAEVPNWDKYVAFEQKYLETFPNTGTIEGR